ncbi:aspartic proteinase nepenthesin-1-like [Papaver somniferum]|uniref:aspartic proteinase nepenthesin-1-like n=1 Tax=Papaver somniferum TaxID=3469 RepID=UPI000E6F6489|nr:aspartic proteinase nepenthesin-1-like [Papaver somniferum]
MGETLLIFLLTITLAPSLVLINSVIAVNSTGGFSIRLIHRDSKESPLYPGDHLTRKERLERLIEQSKARSRYIESQILLQGSATSSINPDFVRLPVSYEAQMWYVAEIGLGTFSNGRGGRPSFMTYYLVVDSGSGFIWLQCDGANPSFNQDDPLYPYRRSLTFQFQPCSTPPEPNCNNGFLTHSLNYGNGAVADITLASEKFTFNSVEINLGMGCGFSQRNWDGLFGTNYRRGKPDSIAGVLGLGSGGWSLVTQLGPLSQSKFSYCLEEFNDELIPGLNTYLRFGSDATIRGGGPVHVTSIVLPGIETPLYYLVLEDISVGEQPVGFHPDDFTLRSDRRNRRIGGTIIDSGSPFSYLRREHFLRVAQLVVNHFAAHGFPVARPEYAYRGTLPLCFIGVPQMWDYYPTITFHFQGGADFEVTDPFALFVRHDEHDAVCLGIGVEEESKYDFIFGAMQQVNKKILYDLNVAQLSFANRVCTQDR